MEFLALVLIVLVAALMVVANLLNRLVVWKVNIEFREKFDRGKQAKG